MTPQELKNSILQLAIQGKLVEQRPEEGTAEKLCQQIHAEKQRLIKAGTIKKQKPLPEITEDEKPFDIPESWKWVRFCDVFDVRDGTHDTPKYVLKGVPLVTSKNLVNGTIDFDTTKLISKEDAEAINMRSAVDDGDILFAMIGTIGNPVLVIKDREFCIKNMALFKAINQCMIDMEYFLAFLQNEQYVMKKKAYGGVQVFVSLKFLRNYLLPLPPLAEQKRIVAKIEELLPYIDRYEKAWSKLEDLNKRFPTDMQKSILQMAIQGKLVEQRSGEGTGEELYQLIQAEKQRLIKAGTIKKEKPLQEITEDEKPFDIPESWVWAKLGALFAIERGSSPRPIQAYLTTSEDGVNWIKIGDSEAGAKYITSTREKITQEGAKKSRLVNVGDFIISNSMSFGRPYIMAINGYVHDGWNIIHIIKLKNEAEFNKDYLYYVLSSNLLVEQMKDKAAGGVVKNIRSDSLRELIIPIPSLAEQKRIVARLEEILPLCEKLK